MENDIASVLAAGRGGQPITAPPSVSDDEEEGTPLNQLVEWFEDAEESTTDARKKSEQARDYYDGKQLTAAELKTLKARGQPDLVINRIQPKINYLIGYEAQNRTDPKAYPRTPNDEQASEAATDGLRYVKDKTELEQGFSGCWENMLIEGFGGLELTVVEGQNQSKEFECVRWDWDRLFYDPHSRKHDFSDARYLGGVVWMDAEDARRKWPDGEAAFDATMGERTASQTYDDRPVHRKWVAGGKRKRVRIVQMYHLEGDKWMYCVFTKGGKLEGMEVPFTDQDGKSWCPLLLQSGFVDRVNNRYGLVSQMMGVQDEINKRRSKSLHRITMRQVQSERGAVDDVEMARAEMAKPDGWIETNQGFAFQVLDNTSQFAGEIQLMQDAKNEIELMGPNAAMQGKDDGAPSGRAILASQSGGQNEIAVLADRLLSLKRRTYRRIWDLIRQYKDQEWWVRVTDNEENVKFVGFNRPVKMYEDMGAKLQQQGLQGPQIAEQLEQIAGQPGGQEYLEQVVRTENQPNQMYMDITIEQVPDVANVQSEQFDMLVKLAPAVTFPPEVYIMASGLRNKSEIMKKMAAPTPDPVAVEAQAIQLEQTIKKSEAEIEKLRAETLKIHTEADVMVAPVGTIDEPAVNEQPDADGHEAGLSASPPPGETGDESNVPPTDQRAF